MSAALRILAVHQGSELYGSDRSFAAAVEALRERHPQATIDLVLPEPGPLQALLAPLVDRCSFESGGVLRKLELKRHPWRSLVALGKALRMYRGLVSHYDICYVNTVVCVAAILALRRSGNAYVHVREIPSALALRVFGRLLEFSRAALIYNSYATAFAFKLPGRVIYNGVEAVCDGPCPPSAPPPPERPCRIVILGRINTWKGQQFVLDALARYGRDLPLQLRIVGDTFRGYEHLAVALERAARECAQPVELFGFSAQPAAHFAWADFVLMPSIQPEPFGRVAIESFSIGRPVIASDAGGLQEIVTDGESGLLFEPGDPIALVRALERAVGLGPERYAAMAAAARDTYRHRFTVRAYREAVANALAPLPASALPLLPEATP
ncbi:glycosyltransferase family 4 protein [Xanthomonas campestris pv. phormiicola]|nr:glycosyltransferase family 4 protein [Xanthomonas campestris pv. phormiicola]UYC16022.1 glycosyltransferase family 4 protein [Xanthomonas campestris pv. phormiicola]